MTDMMQVVNDLKQVKAAVHAREMIVHIKPGNVFDVVFVWHGGLQYIKQFTTQYCDVESLIAGVRHFHKAATENNGADKS